MENPYVSLPIPGLQVCGIRLMITTGSYTEILNYHGGACKPMGAQEEPGQKENFESWLGKEMVEASY